MDQKKKKSLRKILVGSKSTFDFTSTDISGNEKKNNTGTYLIVDDVNF